MNYIFEHHVVSVHTTVILLFRQTESSLHACVAMCFGRAILSSGITYCIQSQDMQTTAVSFNLFSSKHTSPWPLPLDSSIPHHTSTRPYSNYMNVNIIIKTNYLHYYYNSLLQKFNYNKSALVGFNCNSHITMHGMKNKKYRNVHFLCNLSLEL